jgi:hypothetical protein
VNSQRGDVRAERVLAEVLLGSSLCDLGMERGGDKRAWNAFCAIFMRNVTITVHRCQLYCLPIDYSNENEIYSNELRKRAQMFRSAFEWRDRLAAAFGATDDVGVIFGERVHQCVAPTGLGKCGSSIPSAPALGYIVSSLTGLNATRDTRRFGG